MSDCPPSSPARHRNGHHHRRSPWFPAWLIRVTGISAVLCALFLLRACAFENERIAREATSFGSVQEWSRDQGVATVMSGSVSRPHLDGGSTSLNGIAVSELRDPRPPARTFRWMADRDGRVVSGHPTGRGITRGLDRSLASTSPASPP